MSSLQEPTAAAEEVDPVLEEVDEVARSPSVSAISTEINLMEPQTQRRKILATIYLNMTIQLMCMSIITKSQTTLVTITNFITLFKYAVDARKSFRLNPRSVWRLDRGSPWLDQTLLNSHSEKEFTRRCRVKPNIFYYICALLAPALQKSRQGGGIPLENRVVLCLNRLGTGNYLLGCADLFGMSESTASIVVRDFCSAVLTTIRPLVIPTFTNEALPSLAASFESMHGLPFIMGAIDGSHIPIIAPAGDPAHFYNRKGFYYVLLQGIVDTNTRFWDWDFGWAGSLHDYTLFVNSVEGRATMRGDYLPYKLIGDAAYPFKTCMYVPFKGTKEALEPYKAHWNFIQSSTRMCVERAFGVLKCRWRILLRRNEIKLDHLADQVGACICLHNLCILQNDFVDVGLVEEAKVWLQNESIANFSDLCQAGTMKIVDYGKNEVDRAEIDVEELIQQAGLPQEEYDGGSQVEEPSTVGALKACVTMHLQLVKNLFHRHLREQVHLPGAFYESDSSSGADD